MIDLDDFFSILLRLLLVDFEAKTNGCKGAPDPNNSLCLNIQSN